MLDTLFTPLSYSFFVTALAVGAAISVVAALLGTHLSLRGFSMLGDGLSHIGFGAVAVAAAAGLLPLAVAIPVVILAAFFLLAAGGRGGAHADNAIAMLSAGGLAVGLIAASLGGARFDLNTYLFGSVLAVSEEDKWIVLGACAVIFVLYLFCYRAFFSLTFDEDFFAAKTHRAGAVRALLAALAAVVVVIGMQSVGALLISSLLIFPPSAAKQLSRSFFGTVVLSAVLGLFSFVVGLFLSFHLSLPAGAAVVLTNGAVYLVCLALGKLVHRR